LGTTPEYPGTGLYISGEGHAEPRRCDTAFYLVTATPKPERLDELGDRLAGDAFVGLRPFGRTLSNSLKGARIREDGVAAWEEDYCRPPLAQERAAVLDDYFRDLRVQAVAKGEGWAKVFPCPGCFRNSAAPRRNWPQGGLLVFSRDER
jgi:hypothetical protein